MANELQVYLDLGDGVFTCFGAMGYVNNKHPYLVVNGNIIPHTPLTQEIRDVIEEDIKSGNIGRVDHLEVTPNTAISMYIEGTIANQAIYSAVNIPNGVQLNNIAFETSKGPKEFSVVINPDAEFKCASIDNKGKIIW